jgi:hypothetical protein
MRRLKLASGLQTPVKEEEERRNNKYDSIIGWYY